MPACARASTAWCLIAAGFFVQAATGIQNQHDISLKSGLPTRLRGGGNCFFKTNIQNQHDISWKSGLPTRLRGGGNCFSCCFGSSRSVRGDVCEFDVVVHYKGADDSQFVPAILGSAPCLGEWNPNSAIPLTGGPGGVRWTATIRFPKRDGRFEFKYVLVPRNKNGSGAELEWEKGHNRQVHVTSRGQVELGNDSSMPHHIRSPLNIAPPCVDITFLAHWAPERPSQTLAIIGSHEELGAWDPNKAIPLIPGSVDKQNRLQWRVALALPFPLLLEYKFLRVECSEDGEVGWQTGTNRHCMIKPDGQFSFHPDQVGVSFTGEETAAPPALSPMAEGLRGDPSLSALPLQTQGRLVDARGEGAKERVQVKRLGSIERLQRALRSMGGRPAEASGAEEEIVRGASPARVPNASQMR